MALAIERTSRTVLNAGRQFDALNRSIEPVAKSTAALERGQRIINAVLAQCAIDAAQAGRSITMLEQQYRVHTAAADENTEAVGLNRNQSMELMHVSKSLFDQLAAG